ncbi:MAG: tandem-95 repeat protein, partial [Gammaproteobacteria bacterium]|nr:tandem-95 repeat protein [Gammaproteobacteria bacterium]
PGTLVRFGEYPAATDGYDSLYDSAAFWDGPEGQPKVKVYFDHTGWGLSDTDYWVDIKSFAASKQWQLTINSSIINQNLDLSWDIDTLPAGLLFTLTDDSLGSSVNMWAQSSYSYFVSSTANRTFTITAGENSDPVALADGYSTGQNTLLQVNAAAGVLANDSDPEGSTLTAVLDSNTSNGGLSFSGDGSFNYTPAAGFSGTDSFSYHATDGLTNTAVVTVLINVNVLNYAPVVNADSYDADENTLLSVSAPAGVLANDSDVEGDPLTATLVDNVINGSLSLETTGAFTYSPGLDFIGVDSFTYRAYDGTNNSASVATVTINVNASGNNAPDPMVRSTTVVSSGGAPPSMQMNKLYLDQDTVGTMEVLPNDPDAGDTHSYSISAAATNGSVDVDSGGNVTYTPAPGYFGSASFEVTVTDDSGASGVAAVTVTVISSSNTVPVLSAGDIKVREGGTSSTTIVVTDPDVGDTHSFSISVQPAYGTATVDNNGVATYAADNSGYTGSDSFEVTAIDSGHASAVVTVNVNVQKGWFSRVFGCTIGTSTMSPAGSNIIDPTLPLLLLFSGFYLLRRRV